MKSLQPFSFRTGEALSPSKLNAAKQAALADFTDVRSRRYTHSVVVIPFDDIASADGLEVRRFRMRPPTDFGAVEIEGFEWLAHGDDAAGSPGPATLTLSATNVAGWQDVDLTVIGLDKEVVAESNRAMRIAANNEAVFTISGPASGWRVTRCELVLHIRTDRYKQAQPAAPALGRVKAGGVPAAADGTGLSDIGTTLIAEGTGGVHTGAPRIVVVTRRDTSGISGPGDAHQIPGGAGVLAKMDMYVVSGNTATVYLYVTNASSVVASSFVNAPGSTGLVAKVQGTTVNLNVTGSPGVLSGNASLDWVWSAAQAKVYGVLYFT